MLFTHYIFLCKIPLQMIQKLLSIDIISFVICLRTDSIGDTVSSISESSDSNGVINAILDAANQHICGFDLTDVVLLGLRKRQPY